MEERLQKVLAQAGVASRREAEGYILAGRVKVNGKVVKELGTKVGPDAFIMVDGHPIHRERKTYLLFYKPDGELAQALTHPSHEVDKTYEVTVPGIVPQEKLDLLRVGVKLEDGMTAPAVVVLTGYDYEKNLTHFTVTIHEGRNRQVRRMCDAIGFPVRYLRRVMMGTLTLDGLRRGDCRELFHEEIEELRAACGLKRNPEGKAERAVERKPERRAEGKPVRKPEHRTKRRAEEKPEYKGTGRTKRTAGLRANRENAARPNHKKKES